MEKNNESNLCKICIASGPSDEVDIARANKAIEYRYRLAQKVPIKILGVGPDLEEAIRNYDLWQSGEIDPVGYSVRQANLKDHHLELYNHVFEKTGEKPEVVTTSVTLVQNIFHGFREEEPGLFGIVTEPWHYKKFEFAQRVLKWRGRISKDVGFVNIASPDTEYYNLIQKTASWVKTGVGLLKV